MNSEYGTRYYRDLQIPKVMLEHAERSCYLSSAKTGMIYLATLEDKSHSIVSKKYLERTFPTCKAQTKYLRRAAILFTFLFSVTVITYCFYSC